MRDLYIDYLFSKNFFVQSKAGEEAYTAETLISLASLFNIQIAAGAEKADAAMIRVASRNLGEYVPGPFYFGFPDSVKKLTPAHLLFDQLFHYVVAYLQGPHAPAGHSLFEDEVCRSVFNESAPIRQYTVLSAEEAEAKLLSCVEDLLSSSRPLNEVQFDLVCAYVVDYAYAPTQCACKDTAVQLLLRTRDVSLAHLLTLPDVIRLAEYMQYTLYDSENIRELKLRNQDRRLIAKVLDAIFRRGNCDTRSCFEKRRLWSGLLHHIHYKPVNEQAAAFVDAIRNQKHLSAYAAFEAKMDALDICGAVDTLLQQKGSAALLRNLNYILSRCTTDDDTNYVLDHLESKNKIVLTQLLLKYALPQACSDRVIKFARFGKLRAHRIPAADNPPPALPDETIRTIVDKLRQNLADACRGTLGKVYVDDAMKRIALPLQENVSMGGVGVLPKGSRIPLGKTQKIRAFTYWEKVDDIDLSCIGLSESGEETEFSWRTIYGCQSSAITFSGDQTCGYDGGSEYFDIIPSQFRQLYPHSRYLLFCNTVYSDEWFSNCYCTAGYMVRAIKDSGEVFEPKTVASSFRITVDSCNAILFALDLHTKEIIWMNIADNSDEHVAGELDRNYLLNQMRITEVINLHDFATMLATEVVDTPEEADVVFSDAALTLPENTEQIRTCDVERVLALLNQ